MGDKKKRSLPHTTHVHSYISTYINSLGKKNKKAKTQRSPHPTCLELRKKWGLDIFQTNIAKY